MIKRRHTRSPRLLYLALAAVVLGRPPRRSRPKARGSA